VIGLLLIPMCIGLYQQYDLHPEKIIDGETGTSGLKFFFWTQSFGRITGENTWNNGAPFGFLFENMLWSFLPWILLFTISLMLNTVQLFRQKLRLRPGQEWITTGGFILTYCSLASSHYQLPHYIFVAFPLAAIMVAQLLKDFLEGKYAPLYKTMNVVQVVISALLLIAALLTFTVVFKGAVWTYIVWLAGVVFWCWLAFSKGIGGKMLWLSATAIIIANIFMTNHFYYNLLKYQAGSQLGRIIERENIPAAKIKILEVEDPLNSLCFYAKRVIKRTDTLPQLHSGDYLITSKDCLQDITEKGFTVNVIDHCQYFKVSELTPEFLNPSTRQNALKQCYLIRID
jgi:hypothetical protein